MGPQITAFTAVEREVTFCSRCMFCVFGRVFCEGLFCDWMPDAFLKQSAACEYERDLSLNRAEPVLIDTETD